MFFYKRQYADPDATRSRGNVTVNGVNALNFILLNFSHLDVARFIAGFCEICVLGVFLV